MSQRSLLLGIDFALLAIACALAVIIPLFALLEWLYDGGKGLTVTLVAVIVAWAVLAFLLRRRRISL